MIHEIPCNYCMRPVSRCNCNERPILGDIQFYPAPGVNTGSIVYDQPTRDPALRKAALDADRALARWQGSSTDADYDAFCKAMDALREALAK